MLFTPTRKDVEEMSHFRAMLEREALKSALARDPGCSGAGALGRDPADAAKPLINRNFALYSRADSAYHRVILQHAGNR